MNSFSANYNHMSDTTMASVVDNTMQWKPRRGRVVRA